MQQAAQLARPGATDEQHLSTLHAALYGPRHGFTSPAPSVYKEHNGLDMSKAMLSEGPTSQGRRFVKAVQGVTQLCYAILQDFLE